MKIPLGGGAYLEPDDRRASRFRFPIVGLAPIPGTRGVYAILSCGHTVMIFGNPEMMGEHAFCTACRDRATVSDV
jgi:hypothetical protein